MIQQLRAKARELLQSGTVRCVIGYERASDGLTARPFFAYEPAEVDRLIFDGTCTHTLAKYLLNKRGQVTAVVAKPCDVRAINLLLGERQIERKEVFIIGVACPGMVMAAWNEIGQTLQLRCQRCSQRLPLLYDFLVGEPPQSVLPAEAYSEVLEMEARPAEEKRDFWQEHFQRCLRCYACRQVCPGCYCSVCFADELDPLWVGIRIAPAENWVWQVMRAFHLGGRCIGCGECERVCPVNIPLGLLNRKLEKEVLHLFDFRAGVSADAVPPFATFIKDEKA